MGTVGVTVGGPMMALGTMLKAPLLLLGLLTEGEWDPSLVPSAKWPPFPTYLP